MKQSGKGQKAVLVLQVCSFAGNKCLSVPSGCLCGVFSTP